MTVSHTRQTRMSDVQDGVLVLHVKGLRQHFNFSAASSRARAIFPTFPFCEAVGLVLHCPSEDDLY